MTQYPVNLIYQKSSSSYQYNMYFVTETHNSLFRSQKSTNYLLPIYSDFPICVSRLKKYYLHTSAIKVFKYNKRFLRSVHKCRRNRWTNMKCIFKCRTHNVLFFLGRFKTTQIQKELDLS